MIYRIWNKFTSVISAICVLATGAFAARPATQAGASHPTTAVSVNRPVTAVSANHPTTQVQVSHPVTTVVVSHPQTVPAAATAGGGQQSPAASAPTKQAAAPASGQAKGAAAGGKANNLKGAELGQTSGFGNCDANKAEKAASAAAFQAPKKESISMDAMKNATNINSIKSKVVFVIPNIIDFITIFFKTCTKI